MSVRLECVFAGDHLIDVESCAQHQAPKGRVPPRSLP